MGHIRSSPFFPSPPRSLYPSSRLQPLLFISRMTSIKIIAHNLIFIYSLCIALLLHGAQQLGVCQDLYPGGQSTCGNLKWSRGQIVAPGETLNRLGRYKEPHTGIIVRERNNPMWRVRCISDASQGQSWGVEGGHFLINPWWILFRFPLRLHHSRSVGLQCVLYRKFNLQYFCLCLSGDCVALIQDHKLRITVLYPASAGHFSHRSTHKICNKKNVDNSN